MANLRAVKTREDFDGYYNSNGITSVDDKIHRLIEDMGVKAMISEDEETPDEVLAGLEESALRGFWRASW